MSKEYNEKVGEIIMAMISNVVYRLSCFADYSQIKYNNNDVIEVLKAFESVELTPRAIQEILPYGEVSSRMQFAGDNGLLLISIAGERIDIHITAKEKKGFSDEEISSVESKLREYMSKILSIFGGRMPLPYRLAWFTSYVYFELTDDEKAQYRDKFLKEIDFFEENRLDDISVRYGARRDVDINGVKERFNVLTTIHEYVSNFGIENEINGFQIDYDINTWQGNRINRFKSEDIDSFIREACLIQKDLNKEVLP